MNKFSRIFCLLVGLVFANTASAIIGVIQLGAPIAAAIGYGFSNTPPIRMAGTEKSVYGIDWGSLACKADNVYGAQLSFCGGGVTESLYGFQGGILVSGFVTSNKLDHCAVYGAQYGTFAAKSALVNGLQTSGVKCDAHCINGIQLAGIVDFAEAVSGIQCAGFMAETKTLYGLEAATLCLGDEVYGIQLGVVNRAKRAYGVQIGVYNEACSGGCIQLGVVNHIPSAKLKYLPLFNLRFK